MPGAQAKISIVAPGTRDCGNFVAYGRALGLSQAVDRAEIPNKLESRSDAGSAQRYHITYDKIDIRTGRFRSRSSGFDRARNKINTRDLPAAQSKFDRPMPGATAEIERAARGPRSLFLLAIEQLFELLGGRAMCAGISQGVNPIA